MFDSLMHHLLLHRQHNPAFADVDAVLTVECVQAVMLTIGYRSYLLKGYSYRSGLNMVPNGLNLLSCFRSPGLLWATIHILGSTKSWRHLVCLWNTKGQFCHL